MRILVTRADEAATRTAARLSAMGHEPVLMPLFSRVIEPGAAAAGSGPRAGIIFSSANGVAAASPPGDPDEPVYVVGAATAEAARAAGWRDTRTGAGRAADLARLIIEDTARGAVSPSPDRPLVYVAGKTRKPDLEDTLTRTGIAFRTVIGYRMDVVSYSTDFFSSDIMARPIDAILVYSAEAARRLAGLSNRKDVRDALDGAVAVCLSDDVADALGPHWSGRRNVATAPTETALLASFAALR